MLKRTAGAELVRAVRVVAAGGGFAGFHAARRLGRLAKGSLDVVLVNPTDYFLYLPLLPEVAAGILDPRTVAAPLAATGRRVRHVLGAVTDIDTGGRQLAVSDPEGHRRTVGYDQLVIALGSVNKLLPIPGVADHAHGFRSLAEAMYLRDHLLRQTSDWQGTLWGKPDWADRPVGVTLDEQEHRKLWEPGTHFKYNDVRVNVMALAALQVWRRPLPEVLNEYIMEPIGASSTWRWYGYENSWVEIDGRKVQSVSGGGHWGGGMFINAHDMARFGYLTLRRGKWGDRQLLSEKWLSMALTPTLTPKLFRYGSPT